VPHLVQPEPVQARLGPYAFLGFVNGRVHFAGLAIDVEILIPSSRVQLIQNGNGTFIQWRRTHVPQFQSSDHTRTARNQPQLYTRCMRSGRLKHHV
jgi:hypothetical protein